MKMTLWGDVGYDNDDDVVIGEVGYDDENEENDLNKSIIYALRHRWGALVEGWKLKSEWQNRNRTETADFQRTEQKPNRNIETADHYGISYILRTNLPTWQ